MIHLHRLVKQLHKLTKQPFSIGGNQAIYSKSGEIAVASSRIYSKYKEPVVREQLEVIGRISRKMMLDHAHVVQTHQESAESEAAEMLRSLKKIGKLLKIEFKEIVS